MKRFLCLLLLAYTSAQGANIPSESVFSEKPFANGMFWAYIGSSGATLASIAWTLCSQRPYAPYLKAENAIAEKAMNTFLKRLPSFKKKTFGQKQVHQIEGHPWSNIAEDYEQEIELIIKSKCEKPAPTSYTQHYAPCQDAHKVERWAQQIKTYYLELIDENIRFLSDYAQKDPEPFNELHQNTIDYLLLQKEILQTLDFTHHAKMIYNGFRSRVHNYLLNQKKEAFKSPELMLMGSFTTMISTLLLAAGALLIS